jgi:hypothetical protein
LEVDYKPKKVVFLKLIIAALHQTSNN